MASDSDSDSDFGDFGEGTVTIEETAPSTNKDEHTKEGTADANAESEPQQAFTAVEVLFDCMRKILAAKERGIEIRDKNVLFQDLLKNEKTRKVYDALFPNGKPLPPVQWRREPLQKLLRQTLNIDEPQEEEVEEKEEYVIQDLLYLKLEEDRDQKSLEQLGYKKLNAEGVPDADLSQLLSYQDFQTIPGNELPVIHDQLIDAIETVLLDLESLQNEEQELLKDKATYEELITNLVGHTQRIRREEIAEYQRKHKSKSKKKF